MKKKMNNKGFSLVELIVVMAIMAILAVTLAPRLTQYVEKARKASDQEVINAIYTAVQYGLVDKKISEDAFSLDTGDTGTVADILTGLSLLDLSASGLAAEDMYTVTGKSWAKNDSAYNYRTNKLIKEIYEVVSNFKLRSDDADGDTNIVITATTADDLKVELFYTYTVGGTNIPDYTVSASEVR